MNNSIIFSNVERLLKAASFKKMDFYKAIGVTPEGYKWMKEKDTMKTQTLLKIAEVLNVEAEKLLQFPVENSGLVLNEPGEKIINSTDMLYQTMKQLRKQADEIEKYLANQNVIIK